MKASSFRNGADMYEKDGQKYFTEYLGEVSGVGHHEPLRPQRTDELSAQPRRVRRGRCGRRRVGVPGPAIHRRAHRGEYAPLTTEIKKKILGLNAAKLYDSRRESVGGASLDRLCTRLATAPIGLSLGDVPESPERASLLRFARSVRVSIEGDAGFWRGLLHTRYPEAVGD